MRSKHLDYFRGKVCTIFTVTINRNFKEESESPQSALQQNLFYFVGLIEDVDDFGVFVSQVQTGFKSYFFIASIVAICEEEVLNPENEKDLDVINTVKNKDEAVKKMMSKYESSEDGGFLNLDKLSSLTAHK